MQMLTVHTPVRLRVAGGNAVFFDPINGCNQTNETFDSSWTTLEPGTHLTVVAAFPMSHTFMLVVNDTDPKVDGVRSPNSVGMVLRKQAMENLLDHVVLDATPVVEA